MHPSRVLALALLLVAPALADENGGQWAEGVPYTTSWDEAIAQCRQTGKLLLIFNGWEKRGICPPCDGMKDGLKALAGGEGEFARHRELLRSSFVLLNVYCRSVQEEHDPRGPDGPYQFKDRSVPVLVIKRWDGHTLEQQLGYLADRQAGARKLAQAVEQAVAQNGPIVAPKEFRPLMEKLTKAQGLLQQEKLGKAYKELLACIALGEDKEKFQELPFVARDAQRAVEALLADGVTALAAAEADADPRRALKRLQRRYKDVTPLEERIAARLAELGDSKK